jgi:uncharacterized protein (DUF427 family)
MANHKALEDQLIVTGYGSPPTLEVRVEACPRWIRAKLGTVTVADSRRVITLFETRRLPIYYFPFADVRADLLETSDRTSSHRLLGKRRYYNLRLGSRFVEDAAWSYPEPLPDAPRIGDHLAFYWDKLDAWLEEDDEVFVHPRDPYHRVDVLSSSRVVRVTVGGTVLAESRRPRLLFETSLPTRYYLPRADVRMDLLEPSETVTHCPYKGRTIHFNARIGEQVFTDIAWSYPYPIPECPKIEGLICFYDERADAVEVDGVLQERPRTPWS